MVCLLRVLRDACFRVRPDDCLGFVCVKVREEEERDLDDDQDDRAYSLIVTALDHIVDRQQKDSYNG